MLQEESEEEFLLSEFWQYMYFKSVVESCEEFFYCCLRVLQGGSALDDSDSGHGPQFAEVFIIVWGGAAAVTLNIKLLRGNMWVGNVLTHFYPPLRFRN